MNENHSYTLAELAEETGLTGRTVRYYIEQVLPPHHKQGRGKLARYGQDILMKKGWPNPGPPSWMSASAASNSG